MIQKPRALVDQLYLVEGKAEIVNGEIVRMSPAGGKHNWAAGLIYRSLSRHEEKLGGGTAFTDNAGFIVELPNRESFSPDVAWFPCDPADLGEEFLDGAPSFAVEVRSPDDYTPAGQHAFRAKIADYFAAGTLVVWDVDLRNEVIRCYRSTDPSNPQLFGGTAQADAEPAVPGWRFPVKRLLGSK